MLSKGKQLMVRKEGDALFHKVNSVYYIKPLMETITDFIQISF
jgi:hypothetical protein